MEGLLSLRPTPSSFFLYIKKDSQIYFKFLCTFQEKGKEPIRYVVVRKKYGLHPKQFLTSQNFPESNASTPAVVQGVPIFVLNIFGKKCLYVFFCIGAFFALVERLCFSCMRDFFYSLSEM